MSVYKIPLHTGNQRFSITLGGRALQIRTVWRVSAWFLDFYEPDGTEVLCSLPIRCGHNLLEQYQYLGLGKLMALIELQDSRDPDYDDMGNLLTLYWEPWESNTSATAS